MTREEALETIRKTMVEMFDLAPDSVTEAARLVEDLGLDSIDAIDMAGRMHEITGVRAGDEELKTLRTVGDVASLFCAMSGRA